MIKLTQLNIKTDYCWLLFFITDISWLCQPWTRLQRYTFFRNNTRIQILFYMNLPIAFPSFSDFSYARGCLPGCHHVNAHVGTLLVVEPYCNGTGNLIYPRISLCPQSRTTRSLFFRQYDADNLLNNKLSNHFGKVICLSCMLDIFSILIFENIVI